MHKSLIALFAAALVAVFTPAAHAGAYHTLVLNSVSPPAPVEVPAHRMLTIVNFLQTSGTPQNTFLFVTKDGLSTFIYASTQSGTTAADNSHHAPEGVVIVGPATLTIAFDANSTVLFTYKLQAD
jgi:hypothetical protein